MSREEFVGEPIFVDASSVDTGELAARAPGCPQRFTWRGRKYTVVRVLERSRQLKAHEKGYVRCHSFRVLTADGYEMVLRCDRRVRGNPWRLFTVKRPAADEGGSAR